MYTTFINKKCFKDKDKFTEIPEKMIAMHTKEQKGFSMEQQYHFFEVKDSSITSMNLPIDEDEQLKLPTQLKHMTQEVRNEFRFFKLYQF